MRVVVISILFCFFIASVTAHSASEWRSRVIYQLLTDRFAQTSNDPSSPCSNLSTYCGGTFQGIIRKLDYIQGMGFNAIWISPIVENTDNGYHGYWAKNIYNINPHFGTADDLKALVAACHSRDIWVMVDVVGNHMGNQIGGIYDFSQFTPFNSASHYHSYCEIQNWNNQTEVEYCRLSSLPDLDQSNSFVASALTSWIANLTSTFGIDGYRIDTVPEVAGSFWSTFSAAAGVFTIGEVDNGDVGYNAQYQGPLAATLNYPMFYTLRNAFASQQSLAQLQDRINEEASKFSDPTVLGTFIDNHDNTRFLNVNKDWEPMENALVYTFFGVGIPIMYYGTEQGFSGGNDPNCRESLWPSYNNSSYLYTFVSKLLAFRQNVLSTDIVINNVATPLVERFADDQFYAFSRNNILACTTNVGSGNAISRSLSNLPYSSGTVLYDVLDPTTTVTVQSGSVQINLVNGWPRVFYPKV